jgi:hypothetical protein
MSNYDEYPNTVFKRNRYLPETVYKIGYSNNYKITEISEEYVNYIESHDLKEQLYYKIVEKSGEMNLYYNYAMNKSIFDLLEYGYYNENAHFILIEYKLINYNNGGYDYLRVNVYNGN